MDTSLFKFTAAMFILLPLVCLGAIVFALNYALKRAGFEPQKQQKILLGTIATLGFWLAFLSVLSLKGFFFDFSARPPRALFALLPPLVTVLWLTFNPAFGKLLSVIPKSWLLYIQSFRVVVEVLLWLLFIQNLLPVQMSLEGRNFDILAGLTAPVFAYFCFVKRTWSTKVAIAWNIASLCLLLNIVVISILSLPTPLRVFMNEPANTIVTHFPVIFLPAVLVPIAYSMHFFSLRQLMMKGKREAGIKPGSLHQA